MATQRVEAAYVVAVAVTAATGMLTRTPWLVLFAVVVSLPFGLVAIVGYYVGYGLLALVPGANPSFSSGSGTVGPDGATVWSSTGGQAGWFVVLTGALAITLISVAACANVVLLRAVVRNR